MDWLGALDLDRSLANCHRDMIGDWYRDPWGWPELAWVRANTHVLLDRLEAQGVRASALIDVPKVNFATRPALVFDPVDRYCYQALVDAVSVQMIGDLPAWAYGSRLARTETRRGVYTTRSEWEWYRGRLQSLNQVNSDALVTDIVSFFASIPPPNLCDAIEQRANNAITRRVCDLIFAWSRIPGRPGLQQRSLASSVLANMYLRPVDDVLRAEGAGGHSAGKYGRAVRWTDDIWLFGTDPAELRRAQLRLESCMRDLGLNMNAAKTNVIGGNDLSQKVFEIELAYIDVSLRQDPPDPRPLELLVDKLIRRRESAERTAIRFVCRRIRNTRRQDLAELLADAAPRMPQGADHVARMLRELDMWAGRSDWYLSYCGSPWAAIEWAPAQMGTMFPADAAGPPAVADFFRQQVVLLRRSLPFLAVACQRLAAWRPGEARDVIRDAARRTIHPLERRILALSALQAGEDRTFVRNLLSQMEDNQPTLLMLQSTDFRPPTLVPDFTGR